MFRFKLLFLFSVLLAFLGCNRNENSITLPLSSSLNVYYSDTFTVQTSTVLLDSISTSISSRLLVGHIKDPFIGEVTANTYFQMSLAGIDKDGNGTEDILTAATYPIYDSISLLMVNTSYYGDTTQPQTLSVHYLSEVMYYKYTIAGLFNRTSFAVEPEPLGTLTFKYPPFNDTMNIRLKDDFGKKFFNLAYNLDDQVKNSVNFRNLFTGLSVFSDNSANTIYGYSVSPVMRMYFHDSLNPRTSLHYDFIHNPTNTSKLIDLQSNRILNNRSLIPGLNKLQFTYDEVKSSETGGYSFLLTGTDLFPKIEFPYLAYIKSLSSNSIIINRAQLIITPLENTYDEGSYLPSNLLLYTTDETNTTTGTINAGSNTTPEVISPKIDYDNNKNTQYTFDVTNFINVKYRSENKRALFLAPNNELGTNRIERLVIDPSQIKLIIYLTVM